MSLLVREMTELMDELAPPGIALGDDSIGLQTGSPDCPVTNIITTLDVDEATIKEALKKEANLVISHHPIFFSPLSSINYEIPGGALLKEIIQNNINVFSAHTNLDVSPLGVNKVLADIFGLRERELLSVTGYDPLLKLIVFVPEGYEDDLRDAVAEAGAGWIGNYSHCTFQTAGTGTFLPRENTDPFIGSPGKLEKVAEQRLETILPQSLKKAVLDALFKSHPYEEPAYDLYPLNNEGIPYGLGYVGFLEEPLKLKDFAKRCCSLLNTESVCAYGSEDRIIRKIAVCGGSGGSLIKTALKKEADLLLSGDLKYHDIVFALSEGLALVDAGHYATEYPVVPYLADYLGEKLKARGYGNKIWPAAPGTEQKKIITP